VIKISNLGKRFDKLQAVDDLSFQIHEGEIFGLLGPNGAGKTTTVKMMVGMLKPDTGSIEINGFNAVTDSLKVKADLGYVPESSALYENLTGREHLEMVCNLHHLPPQNIDSQVDRLLDAIELKESADKRITGYSKGMKQRLLLAGAIIHNPRVLILDEPMSGLDANVQSVIRQLIKDFARDKRIVIFCSHILEVVERLCNRLLIIHQGRKLIEGTPQEITSKMGTDSLNTAFNELTGATDIDLQARGILDAIENRES
jgi:ABC-2 type transport system ATP-binding protein